MALTAKSQDSLSSYLHWAFYQESSISIGYNYSFAEPNEENFHLIEARYQKQTFGGRHASLFTLSAGSDLGINTSDLLIGPRIGALFGYGVLFIGIDLAYYTDFEQGTLRLIPSIGMGYQQFRISINPHVRITNSNFEPIDRGHANLTIKLFRFKRRKME